MPPPRGKQRVPTVGVMYSTVDFKGCDISLKAYELARKEVPELKLVAFGAIDPRPSCPCRKGRNSVFKPPQERIKDYYARCTLGYSGQKRGFRASAAGGDGLPNPGDRNASRRRSGIIAPGGGIPGSGENPQAMAEQIVRVARMDEAGWKSISDKAYEDLRPDIHGMTLRPGSKLRCCTHRRLQEVPE